MLQPPYKRLSLLQKIVDWFVPAWCQPPLTVLIRTCSILLSVIAREVVVLLRWLLFQVLLYIGILVVLRQRFDCHPYL